MFHKILSKSLNLNLVFFFTEILNNQPEIIIGMKLILCMHDNDNSLLINCVFSQWKKNSGCYGNFLSISLLLQIFLQKFYKKFLE